MTLAASKPTYTPEDVLRLSGDKLYELVDGQLVEKQVGAREAWVATQLSHRLESAAGGLGLVIVEVTVEAFGPARATVRRPDVCYVRPGRLPDDLAPEGHLQLVPDLCVEVISPNDLAYDVDEKVELYLNSGAALVWVVNPAVRNVRVHRADGTLAKVDEDQALSGESVLPSFNVVVRDFLPKRPTPTTG
jgi:Uma2 family endonuclease